MVIWCRAHKLSVYQFSLPWYRIVQLHKRCTMHEKVNWISLNGANFPFFVATISQSSAIILMSDFRYACLRSPNHRHSQANRFVMRLASTECSSIIFIIVFVPFILLNLIKPMYALKEHVHPMQATTDDWEVACRHQIRRNVIFHLSDTNGWSQR